MPPPTASPAQARAIRRRLLERVADTESRLLTVPPGAAGWQPFGDGVQIKVLHEHEGGLSYLLKLAPGARIAAHRHPVDEECVVLEGVLKVGSRIEVGPGGYHLARAGSLHASLGTETGATIFLRGAEPHADQLLV
ncbi:cupin domain-containing protein [Roseateles cellulosilyticus]|uniref:Cupin domain-containing protein n=1 Tax=Pelomonas cellulosilytica TaxID=2906762 RepID=A0ABS8XRW0_9BURK|nr:cupin domain-containing protein [Pelomonas sp. P8]MCE4553424.1 cupin domain-containing protein [Pelomonas sp. P8]